MRVAIITENFLPKLDGVTRTLGRLLEHLQANGHQALLLGPDSGMDYYAGAEVIGTAGLPLPFYPELKFNFFRPLFMRRLNEFQPDIIHLVDPVVLGATGLAAGHLLHIPLVSSYHTNLAAYCEHFGFSLLKEPMWSYNRFIHNQGVMTFCPSPSTAAMLHMQGFEHLRIWPRGVDTTLFTPTRSSNELRATWLTAQTHPENKVVLLYVGRISWEKNLNLLIQTYQQMDHDRCHLVIVGDGPALTEVQQRLTGLPVTFTGYLSGEALAAVYASADIFAFPSRTETFGQVVLEAMASGLPVIGVLSEGVCDLVNDGQTGFLLNEHRLSEEEKIAGFRASLARLIADKQLRDAMSKVALLEAQSRSWHEAMECLVKGYCEVIEAAKTLVAA
jgi:glycosyltransferase involved in cell wall biosynthesis